jgi:fucose 4-O-acetylase-like acetyltransferase
MARYQFIDIAKGIAIIGVVFAHHASGIGSTSQGSYYAYAAKIIFSVVMPFFFMISAAFFRRRLDNAANSNWDILKKISASLLKPFYTLGAMFFLLNLAAPKSLGMNSAADMIRALLYMQSNGAIMPSGVLWFLFTLYTASLITFISIRILKLNAYALLLVSIILKIFAHKMAGIYYFGVDKLFLLLVYYIVGYMLSEHILSGALFRRAGYFALYLGYWIVALGFRMVFRFRQSLAYDIVTGHGIFISVSGSFFLLDLSNRIAGRFPTARFTRILAYCGINSIVIYVFHTSAGLVINHIIHRIGPTNTVFAFFVLFSTGIVLPLLVGKLLRLNAALYNALLGRAP